MTGYMWAGVGLSLVATLAVALKWKLPLRLAAPGVVVATVVAAVPFYWLYPLLGPGWWWISLGGQVGLALAVGLGLLMVRFWRDPDRVPPEEEGVVLSAADGEVLYVYEVPHGETPIVTKRGRDYSLNELLGSRLLEGPAHVIGIEMTFVDVHVNRCPVAGEVRSVDHIGGNFLSLRKDEAPFVNERATTVIENNALTVAVVQVASRLVRRIETYLDVGSSVAVGQRLGMIRMGSLVAVVVPKRDDVRITTRVGDTVTAGITVLARYSPREEMTA